MAKLAIIKTKETDLSVSDYINGLQNEQQRADSFKLIDMMQKATKEKPKMWGSSIIGFGLKRYKIKRWNQLRSRWIHNLSLL